MPTYQFWYSETDTYKGWFTADNLEQAKELLEKVQNGEINTYDLPDWDNKSKNYEVEVSLETLREVSNG